MLVGMACTLYSVVGQEGLEGFGKTEKYERRCEGCETSRTAIDMADGFKVYEHGFVGAD